MRQTSPSRGDREDAQALEPPGPRLRATLQRLEVEHWRLLEAERRLQARWERRKHSPRIVRQASHWLWSPWGLVGALVLGLGIGSGITLQRLTPKAPPVLEASTNSIGMTFVLIPAGTFTMGSDMLHNEKPVHPVRLSKPFWLSRHEVTQEQWQVVMGGNPSRFADNPKRPVERVSWEDVQEFLQRLNIREGWARYRLPTEAEWEYAARADTTTPYSFTGPLLTLLSKHAWYRDSAAKQTHPVGQLQPNPWGLYDMHGNVWEWVQDWYQDWYAPTTAEPVIDPTGPPSGSTRVIRGGSWYDSPVACRSTYRNGEVPGYRYDGLGFRLARDVSNPAP